MPILDEITEIQSTQDRTDRFPASMSGCLVVLNGENVGNRFPLDGAELFAGRSAISQIRLNHHTVSRLHAKFTVDEETVNLQDLGSTNGTFLNDRKITEAKLNDGDIVRIGRTLLKYLSGGDLEQKYHEQVYRLSTTDALTQTFNRRYLLEVLERELVASRHYGRPFALAMLDIDNFKQINDQYGHRAGDFLLRKLAEVILRNLRETDTLARYGGDEFSILLHEQSVGHAFDTCERLRALVAGNAFPVGDESLFVTISFGVCSVRPDEERVGVVDIISEADSLLLKAKRDGRNRTVR